MANVIIGHGGLGLTFNTYDDKNCACIVIKFLNKKDEWVPKPEIYIKEYRAKEFNRKGFNNIKSKEIEFAEFSRALE